MVLVHDEFDFLWKMTQRVSLDIVRTQEFPTHCSLSTRSSQVANVSKLFHTIYFVTYQKISIYSMAVALCSTKHESLESEILVLKW